MSRVKFLKNVINWQIIFIYHFLELGNCKLLGINSRPWWARWYQQLLCQTRSDFKLNGYFNTNSTSTMLTNNIIFCVRLLMDGHAKIMQDNVNDPKRYISRHPDRQSYFRVILRQKIVLGAVHLCRGRFRRF